MTNYRIGNDLSSHWDRMIYFRKHIPDFTKTKLNSCTEKTNLLRLLMGTGSAKLLVEVKQISVFKPLSQTKRLYSHHATKNNWASISECK